MTKEDQELFTVKKGGSRNLERFCLVIFVLAALGLIVGLIVYFVTNPPGETNYEVDTPQYPPDAESAISNGEKWLKNNTRSGMGWADQLNADAVLGLRLGRMTAYNPNNCQFNLMAKSLEYDLLSALYKDSSLSGSNWGSQLLSKYILALRGVCIDAEDFHGFKLFDILENHYTALMTHFHVRRNDMALLVLAKCTANRHPTRAQIDVLTTNPGNFSSVEEASLVIMALSCLDNDTLYYSAQVAAETYLISQKMNDSFGDTYNTGIAVQAMTRSNMTNAEETIRKANLYISTDIQDYIPAFKDYLPAREDPVIMMWVVLASFSSNQNVGRRSFPRTLAELHLNVNIIPNDKMADAGRFSVLTDEELENIIELKDSFNTRKVVTTSENVDRKLSWIIISPGVGPNPKHCIVIPESRKGQYFDIGEAALVLPALAKMSLVDLKDSCANLRKVPKETVVTEVSVTIKIEGGVINSTVDRTFQAVKINKGSSLLDAMAILHNTDTSFTYSTGSTSFGHFVTSVIGLSPDLNELQKWNIYKTGSPLMQSKYVDKIRPEMDSEYVLRAE